MYFLLLCMYRFTYELVCAWKILYSLSDIYNTELTMPRLRMRGAMLPVVEWCLKKPRNNTNVILCCCWISDCQLLRLLHALLICRMELTEKRFLSYLKKRRIAPHSTEHL